MTKTNLKKIAFISAMIAITCVAMAYSQKRLSHTPVSLKNSGPINLTGHLVQDKIYIGGDGMTTLALTLEAGDVIQADTKEKRDVDMVVVLDRSGSMAGDKITKARQAAVELLSGLSGKDRFAIISYSNDVTQDSGLVQVTDANREYLISRINQINSSGGTNLGAGLKQGIDLVMKSREKGHSARIILISDGLANQGITDPSQLGNMAANAGESGCTISTVGVGTEFNEQLMTAIADHGTGNYYFLENPAAFAAVFKKELHHTQAVAAANVKVVFPQSSGIRLVDASGYPVTVKGNQAVFHPGDILSGQNRKLYLKLQIPAQSKQDFEIKGIHAQYDYNGEMNTVMLEAPLKIACVNDLNKAIASVDKEAWEEKVIQEDFNKLREEVALDIKKGKPEQARARIESYHQAQQSINVVIGSEKVAENLDEGLSNLKEYVKDTFSGTRGEVARKQSLNAKSLQYDGYKGRRVK